MERNCQICIHHISGLCSKWDCEMTTLKDYRDKVIDEFAEKLKPYIYEYVQAVKRNSVAFIDINQIAEQMKGSGSNERNIIQS